MRTVSTPWQSEHVFDDLVQIVGKENVTREPCDLVCYEKDFSLSANSSRFMPDCIIQPETTEQVSQIVKLANRHQIPLVPRGGGTGMWGGAIPAHGGLVLDMRKMHRILDVDVERRLVTVQAGALVRSLTNHLARLGFFVADKPESWFAATVGARTQANGVGLYNARYGQSVNQIICLEVVLPTGEVIRTGPPKTYDPATGYDLTRLFSYGEGTLGIVTEVSLRIYKLPEYRVVRIIEFPNCEEMISAAMAIRDSGLVPETLETMDGASYRIYLRGVKEKNAATEQIAGNMGAMVVGYAGVKPLTDAQLECTQAICNRFGANPAPDKCVEAWTAFKEAYPTNPFPLCATLKKKSIKYVLDATVHLESTADVMRAYHQLIEKYAVESHGIVAVHCAPDFHAAVCAQAYVDERNEQEVETIRKMQEEIHRYVTSIGGGIGGCGGIGLMRLEYERDHNAPAADVMRRVKQALDPNHIMNPGKKY
jgi:glycolate oxidase